MISGDSFRTVLGAGTRIALRLPLQAHFELFWAPVARMTLRWPLEARFEQFWDLVPEWLPDGLWKLILCCSGLWKQNGSQIAFGGSF